MLKVILILILVFGTTSVQAASPWDVLSKAHSEAIRDPNVWVPLLGIAALRTNDLDRKISDKLRKDTPIFGGTEEAKDASDGFRNNTMVTFLATGLYLTKDYPKLLPSELLAVEAKSNIVVQVKEETGRLRPDESDYLSFPSGHAASSSVYAEMAKININLLPVTDDTKHALNLTMDGMAVGTAWARVEGGRHYPTDVLAGYALGRYIGHITKHLITPDNDNVVIFPYPDNDSGLSIFIGIQF